MNRLPSVPRSRFVGARGLLLAGLLAWAVGCAVEDPVAYILSPDSGSGPLSTDDEGPDGQWAPSPDEGFLPDCARDVADAGVPCGDAGVVAE
ncbi:hypothetical protein [Pyxidicoccus trucidator]|uniref:hypothetical protein n=1 Tax=Pyxidicoccus trucidator TaxID=2709662 RepID=UPI0013DB3A53|nr:hypothetical protein [Pyxidicoccus trucidator]